MYFLFVFFWDIYRWNIDLLAENLYQILVQPDHILLWFDVCLKKSNKW